MPRARRARGESDSRDHRQPECQERREGGRCADPAGYDAGKEVRGKKRRVLAGTQGLLMHALVHAADVQSLPSDLIRGTAPAAWRAWAPG